MNSRVNIPQVSALAARLIAAAAAPSVAPDEPQVFNAFAPVEADGTIVRAAEKQFVVVATMAGRFYVETGEGPIESGVVSCAASARLDQATAKTNGQGACTVTAHDGATAWGDWQCEGYQLVGCRGAFKLAGGTGRFEGATGESTLVWRPSAHAFSGRSGMTLDKAAGLLLWRDFKVSKAK